MSQCNHKNSHNVSCTLIALLAGAAAGAILAALTTKKTGVERRDDLKNLSHRLKLKAQSLTREANQAWDAVKDYAKPTGRGEDHTCGPECGDDCYYQSTDVPKN